LVKALGRRWCGSLVARASAFERITVEARWVVSPAFTGRGFPVAAVVAMVADGVTVAQIADELPAWRSEDVAEALRSAADALLERELPLVRPGVRVLVGQSLRL